MSINLVTYANQTVTPTNDAIIYERAIDQNGIFYGCNVTVSGNEVLITGGYGMVCGREFTIDSEAIAVTLAPSGTLDGRLYVRLDLADADAPIQLLTATGNTLPALEQDADVNYTNGTYEMELATFDVGVSALSNVVETFSTIQGNKTMLDSAFNNCIYRAERTATGYGFSANQSRTDLSRSVISKAGYTPFLVGAYCNTHTQIKVQNAYISNGTIYFWAVNTSSSSVNGVDFRFDILYFRNEMYGGQVT